MSRPENDRKTSQLHRFLPYLLKYKGILVFDLFCAALTTLCDIVLPSIMRYLTNAATDASIVLDGWYRSQVGAALSCAAHRRRRGKLLYVRHRAHHGRVYRDRHAPRCVLPICSA